ncbi:MAG: hypothetical protein EON98_14385 [Chitinophagaceae bacterium]|nr:MAG: hypothetical protein EON98_14385 [Chitinophagaceae bacterium]
MKKIIRYLLDYIRTLNPKVFFISTIFTAAAVYLNYTVDLNGFIYRQNEAGEFIGWYLLFLITFGFGYLLQAVFLRSPIFRNKKFVALLLIAPALFAWKMIANIEFNFSTDFFKDEYWNDVIYWPFKVIVLTAFLHIVYRFFDRGQPFYGATFRNFQPKPYLMMLLVMIPLIAAASTQPDFLDMYPRFQKVEYLLQPDRGWQLLPNGWVKMRFYPWPCFTAPFILASRWANASPLILVE